MNAVIVDTSAYSNMLKGNSTIAATLGKYDIVLLPLTTLAELRAGHKGGSKEQDNEKILNEFMIQPTVETICADDTTTRHYAELFFIAKTAGRALSNNDIWVASLALQFGADLLTSDKDFEVFVGTIGVIFV
jgi:tRNA(fMet)-specific endonuclease VapC